MVCEAGEMLTGFFFQAEDGIRDVAVTGVQTCALPLLLETPQDAAGLARMDGVILVRHPRLQKPQPVIPPNATFMKEMREVRASGSYIARSRSEERRIGKECRSRWSPNH